VQLFYSNIQTYTSQVTSCTYTVHDNHVHQSITIMLLVYFAQRILFQQFVLNLQFTEILFYIKVNQLLKECSD